MTSTATPAEDTVRAVVCTELTGEDALEVRDRPRAPLGPRAVRIAVRAASVNYPDVLMIRGQYQARTEPPFVPGTEAAGDIVEVGAEVTGLAVGDRVLSVVGVGAFATEAVVTPPWQQVHRIPDAMPYDEAAAFDITYGTAYHGLIGRGGLVAGESVLVTGASGGCGSAAVQVAKAAGARVLAVAGGAEKTALVRELGADAAFDHRELDPADPKALSALVRQHTGGQGVDVVFDTVGGADIREPLRALAWNGRYLAIGFAGGIPTVSVNQTILKCISIIGVAYGMSALHDPAANARDMKALFDWYREGKVRPSIGHRYPLAEAAEALRVVRQRRVLGKVVIEMPSDVSSPAAGR
ncbi:NADPH:quinone oxidoreductase family protein [Frankia sp. CNm7]|uniref:NADPH:quinone oxidoreductase family protein n=1 Tax=Frankia nepalensis TaxID=1836974 RepID=A0A937RQ27_9ACTN|nr:NADPH:quinone oxidoreductase family protein [Frankia nepalensis]MBL7502065.1 NADPH:quinone oxidoreductase family protein [Frankia nepalensis]MBL7511971.1 NADPH:quinone oxidoreductase family protein [Frankia nepalensis]MBL7524039.1 NADPH:quinone oxidoreductase family protein [Frankia nepalensis]MBL7630563.1 NADPH:quinone oxidoreductase family protein [Frankia nepalensis]